MRRFFSALKLQFLLLLFIFVNSNQTQAQVRDTIASRSNKGIYISAGYGAISLVSIFQFTLTGPPKGFPTEQGPYYFKFEKRLGNFGVGINFAYLRDKWAYSLSGDSALAIVNSVTQQVPVTGTQNEMRSTYSLLARLNYHFINKRKLDVYYGFGLGARITNMERVTKINEGYPESDLIYRNPEGYQLNNFPIGFEFSLGAKYLVSPRFALYVETGASKSLIQAGITYNIPHK